jgi:hypothetical protein
VVLAVQMLMIGDSVSVTNENSQCGPDGFPTCEFYTAGVKCGKIAENEFRDHDFCWEHYGVAHATGD